jgi:hypothetical protein
LKGTKPVLIIPGLFSAGVEKPDKSGRFIPSDHIEDEVGQCISNSLGQVHFTWRAMREHEHGGPMDDLGKKLKAKHYNGKAKLPKEFERH